MRKRKDGTPRVAVTPRKDPLPYAHVKGEYRYPSLDNALYFCGGDESFVVFDPRPGYIQNEEEYDMTPHHRETEG